MAISLNTEWAKHGGPVQHCTLPSTGEHVCDIVYDSRPSQAPYGYTVRPLPEVMRVLDTGDYVCTSLESAQHYALSLAADYVNAVDYYRREEATNGH